MRLNPKRNSLWRALGTNLKRGVFLISLFFVAPILASAATFPDVTSTVMHASQQVNMVGQNVSEYLIDTTHAFVNDTTRTTNTVVAIFTVPLDFINSSALDYTHFTTEVGQTIAQNVTDAAQSSADLYRGVYAFVTTPVINTTNAITETLQGEVRTASTLAMSTNTIYENTLASLTNTARTIATQTQNATLAFNPASQAGALLPAVTDTLQSGYNAIYNFWGNVLRTVTPTPEVTPLPSTPTTTLITTPPTPQVAVTPQTTIPRPSREPAGSPTTINRTVVTQPVIERTIERTRVLSGVTATDLATQIADLRSELLTEISKGKTQAVADNNALYLAMAPMNRINNLSSVTISNPVITGASITGTSISGYLPSTGGSLSGDLAGSTGSFTTLGVGTTTPSDTFAVNGVTYLADVSAPAVTTNRLYSNSGSLYWNGSLVGGGAIGNWTASGSDVYRASGNVGIGTTSPYAALSVVGQVVGSYFTATSTTATSTFTAGVNVGTGNGYFINGAGVLSLAGSGLVVGNNNTHTSTGVTLGKGNTNSGTDNVALGSSNTSSATGFASVAVGYINTASGNWANAIGWGNNATSSFSAAYGYANNSGGNGSVAIGNSNSAYAAQSVAIGRNVINTTANSLMIGPSDVAKITIISGGNVGIGTTSPYAKLSVVGQIVADSFNATSTTATSTFTAGMNVGTGNGYFIGGLSAVSGALNNPTSFGFSNTVTSSALAFGSSNTSTNALATAFGNSNTANALASTAFGYGNQATSSASVAFGYFNNAGGSNSVAVGLGNNAYAAGSIAIGGTITNTTANSLMIGPSDAAKLTILSTGNVGIGTTSPYAKLSVVGNVVADSFIATSTTATSTFMGHLSVGSIQASALVNGVYFSGGLTSWLDNVAGIDDVEIGLGRADNTTAAVGSTIFGGRSRGTLSSPLTVQADDTLLTLQAVGHDGTGFAKSSLISFAVDGTPGASVMPGRIMFSTSPAGSQTPAERMRITSGGFVGIGTTSPYAVLSVVGATGVLADIFTATSTTATSTFSGGLDVGSGALKYDYGAGLTSIQNLELGSLSFDTNAGVLSWMDMPVTASSTVGTVQSYSAQLDGNPLLTVYGESDGVGNIRNGSIGIGTTSPNSILTVSTASSTNVRPLFTIASSTGASFLTVTNMGYVGIGTTSPLSTFVTVGSACISKGAGATALCNTTAGTITANAYVTAAADLAERYKTDDPTLEAGEITMLDPNKSLSVMRASKDQDAAIFGVVSTEPGFLLGSYNTLNEASTTVPIALSGRVPLKVTNEGGEIKIGDKITLSSTAGKGMKASSMRAAIGTALENFSGTEGTILAFVNVTGTKLDPAISKGTIGDGQSSFWSIDDSSGRLKYIAALDLNDFDIINVKAIRGSANKWSIDAFGRLVVEDLEVRGSAKIGSPDKRTGITLYDETTGAPYCISVSGGAQKTTAGECGSPTSAPVVTPAPEPAPVITPEPVVVDAPATEPTPSPEPTSTPVQEPAPVPSSDSPQL